MCRSRVNRVQVLAECSLKKGRKTRKYHVRASTARDSKIYLDPRSRDRDLLQSETGPVKYAQNRLALQQNVVHDFDRDC